MTTITINRVHAISRHRNGIGGAPFHAVIFSDGGPEGSRKLAVLFDEPNYIAVLDIAKLAGGNVAFRENSWRGDLFEPSLRRAIHHDQRTPGCEQDDANLEQKGE